MGTMLRVMGVGCTLVDGEHGDGSLQLVQLCAKVGMNYASCSPFRVPIARLAAAQAAVEE